ncbi:MAG: MBL fold metallo-hydrolase [Candidatus Lokiarchaeota archaeon]|nr:MBL fold metallo-hydrolase [Candidatus Lokiarchaeota archaeon]
MNASTGTFEQLNPAACKTYLIGRAGNEVAIIDPVLEELDRYMSLLQERGLVLTHVLETHTHADHISGAAALKDRTGAVLVMHEKAPARCADTSARVIEGDTVSAAGIELQVLHTPGHTKDSVSYIVAAVPAGPANPGQPGMAFTGDALFLDDGGAGRDDLPGGDPGDHYDSLQKIARLEGSLVVYPAHDYRNRQPSSLRQQLVTNPHLKPRTRDEFIDYITELKLGPADWMKDVLAANYACSIDPKAAWIPADGSACEVKGTLDLGVNDQRVDAITPRQLKMRLEAASTPVLVDVREGFELDGQLGKLDNVIHVPITRLAKELSALEQYKDRDVVVLCKIGGRSYTGAQILQQAGFSRVSFLEGGMIGWRNAYGNKNG